MICMQWDQHGEVHVYQRRHLRNRMKDHLHTIPLLLLMLVHHHNMFPKLQCLIQHISPEGLPPQHEYQHPPSSQDVMLSILHTICPSHSVPLTTTTSFHLQSDSLSMDHLGISLELIPPPVDTRMQSYQ